MFDFSSLIVYISAAFILLITPGPAVIYIVTRTLNQGTAAGIFSIIGLTIGSFIYILTISFGVGALITESELLFNIIKYLGAAYLIYLGVQKIFFSKHITKEDDLVKGGLLQIMNNAILVSLLNPKSILFFLAFLPQFVDVNNGSVSLQLLLLGIIFLLISFFTDGSYVLLAGKVRGWFKLKRNFLSAQNYASGTVYILLGLFAAFSGN